MLFINKIVVFGTYHILCALHIAYTNNFYFFLSIKNFNNNSIWTEILSNQMKNQSIKHDSLKL